MNIVRVCELHNHSCKSEFNNTLVFVDDSNIAKISIYHGRNNKAKQSITIPNNAIKLQTWGVSAPSRIAKTAAMSGGTIIATLLIVFPAKTRQYYKTLVIF